MGCYTHDKLCGKSLPLPKIPVPAVAAAETAIDVVASVVTASVNKKTAEKINCWKNFWLFFAGGCKLFYPKLIE